jgi:hypothetical protein
MKKTLLISALFCILCTVSYGSTKASSEPANVHQDHEWVDLGLSVKWATCNVGASTPDDYGNYYAWGDTKTKSNFNLSNCVTLGKSCSDIGGSSSLDAARANWGGNWRMPTKAEFQELIDNCTWAWTSQNGHNGYKVTSKKNSQSIFLPAAGGRYGDQLNVEGLNGYYWSSTPAAGNDTEAAFSLCFDKGSQNLALYYRVYGWCVRPVLADSISQPANVQPANDQPANVHEWVDLGLPSGLKWATCNVGATNSEDCGDYFAWGETSTKSDYSSDNCLAIGKSWGDISGDPSRDAATANWGGSWRMPTEAEFQELKANCTWIWTVQNGKKGYKVISKKNNQSIFLPAIGYRDGCMLYYDDDAFYWTSTPYPSNTNYANLLFFFNGGLDVMRESRRYGLGVRPVLAE